jgi:hypothetical protein
MPSIEQYPILEVPGVSGLRIPLWKTANTYDDSLGTEVPDWMIRLKNGNTKSTLSGNGANDHPLTEYTRLCGFQYELSHSVLESSEIGYYPSGIIWASTVHLVLQNGGHKVYITKAVSDGLITPSIEIVRLVRVGDGPVLNQSIRFRHCHWNYITSSNDFIVAGFTAIRRINTVYSRKQRNGDLIGHAVVITNYSKNQVELDQEDDDDDN